MRAKGLVLALLTALIPACTLSSAVMAENANEGNPAQIVGYYHSDEADILMLANGTGYTVDASSDHLLDGPYDFTVFFSGDDFVIAGDESYILFREQKEKGRSEGGGRYYAVYTDFLGMGSEIIFDEGKQVRFGDYIFDNDYTVYLRESLMTFFGENIGVGATGRMEGNGFDTPEDALGAYIEGLIDNSIEEMIAAYAVETYAENFSIVRMTERIGVYQPSYGFIPNISAYSMQLNVEKRRSDIITAIRNQYLVLQGSKTVLGEDAYRAIPLKDWNDSAADLINDLFISDDAGILETIEFNGEFYDPGKLSKNYSAEQNRKYRRRQAEYMGAEDLVSVAAKFYSNTEPVVIMADAVRYDGRWYLSSMSGNIGSLLGLTHYVYGMLPLRYDEEGELSELFGEEVFYESIEEETEW